MKCNTRGSIDIRIWIGVLVAGLLVYGLWQASLSIHLSPLIGGFAIFFTGTMVGAVGFGLYQTSKNTWEVTMIATLMVFWPLAVAAIWLAWWPALDEWSTQAIFRLSDSDYASSSLVFPSDFGTKWYATGWIKYGGLVACLVLQVRGLIRKHREI